MRKLHLKSILSMVLMVCLIMGSTVVCYAYDGNTKEEVNADVSDLSVLRDETATPLLTVTDGVQTRSGVINGPNYTTTTGYFGGSFTVPSEYNYHMIRIHWRCDPLNGANSSATFKMTVTGNGTTNTVYLPVCSSAQPFTIADLPAGTYNFSVSPNSNVSGSYLCTYQFYAY